FFAPGQFQPDSTQGKKLLAHELTHTVQNLGGTEARAKGRTTAPGDAVEQEANAVAEAVTQKQSPQSIGAASPGAGFQRQTNLVDLFKSDFGTELKDFGESVEGWEDVIDSIRGKEASKFVEQFLTRRHGQALVAPLITDPQSMLTAISTPVVNELAAVDGRWAKKLVKEAGRARAATIEKKAEETTDATSIDIEKRDWHVVGLSYGVSSLLVWLRQQVGANKLRERLESGD